MLREPVRRIVALLRGKPEPESGTVTLAGQSINFAIIRKAKRKRSVAFTLAPDGTLQIHAPIRTRVSFITRMLHARSALILRRIAAMEKNRAPDMCYADGDTIMYLGYRCRLAVTRDATKPNSCRLLPRRLEINIADTTLSAAALRDEVRMEIRLWMKKRAKMKMQKRLDVWAQKLNVRYQKLLITEPERQWGSCTVQNVIRLNWRLLMAPLPILDYVAAHELCHVPHKNHSPRFWKCLGNVMPDYKMRRQELRRMGNGLVV